MKRLFILCCTLLLLFGCTTTPKVDIQKEKEIILNLENQWTDAILAKDMGSVINLIAPDIVFVDPGSPVMTGIEEYRKGYETWLADTTIRFNTYTFAIDNIDMAASGDLAYVLGHSQRENITANGPIQVKTQFLDIWKKYDGEWKCALNIGYNDLPTKN